MKKINLVLLASILVFSASSYATDVEELSCQDNGAILITSDGERFVCSEDGLWNQNQKKFGQSKSAVNDRFTALMYQETVSQSHSLIKQTSLLKMILEKL